VAAIPANPFGPGASTDPQDAHVVEALLRRVHEASAKGEPEVVVWGTGTPRRDFLYVDDLADALLFLMERYAGEEPINVSSGTELSIRELAERVVRAVGYEGRLRFDPSRPDGAPRKALDGGPLRALGWRPRTSLEEALAATSRWVAAEASGAPADG
jgi:GDP-L-fucose synthase